MRIPYFIHPNRSWTVNIISPSITTRFRNPFILADVPPASSPHSRTWAAPARGRCCWRLEFRGVIRLPGLQYPHPLDTANCPSGEKRKPDRKSRSDRVSGGPGASEGGLVHGYLLCRGVRPGLVGGRHEVVETFTGRV